MARLASIERMGYYPTPLHLDEIIASYVQASPGGWILDPCCGKGLFIRSLGERLELKTLGIEVNYDRAREASRCLARVITCDFFAVQGSHRQFRACWNNPPYMFDDGIRVESKFNQAMRYVTSKGWYGWCVPATILKKQVARSMTSALSDVTIWRFPDDDFEAYKQVVLMGLIKAQPFRDDDETARLAELFKDPASLPILTMQAEPLYELPAVPKGKFFMAGQFLDPVQMKAEINDLAFENELASEFFFPEHEQKNVSVMPLRHGHLLQLLAAGVINNVQLQKGDAHVIVSGRTRYVIKRKKDEDGSTEWWEKETQVSKPVTDLCVLDMKSGVFQICSDEDVAGADRLSVIFDQWVQELAQAVIDQFEFLYDFDFTHSMSLEQQRVLSQIGLARALPGKGQGGLLAGQLHSVAAAYQSLARHKHVFFNATMSFGKSPCYVALMALKDLDYRQRAPGVPALYAFVTEPHLVEKMVREVQDFWTVYNGGNGRKLIHLPVAQICETPADVTALVRQAFLDPARPRVAIMSRMRIKLTAGWEPVWKKEPRLLMRSGKLNEPFYMKRRGSFRSKETVRWQRVGIPDFYDRQRISNAGEVKFTHKAVMVDVVIDEDDCDQIIDGSEREVVIERVYTRDEWTGRSAPTHKGQLLFSKMVRSELFGEILGRCPTCGSLIRDRKSKKDPGEMPAIMVGDEELEVMLGKVHTHCEAEITTGEMKIETCGAALWQETRQVKNKVGGREYRPTFADLDAKYDSSKLTRNVWPVTPPAPRYPLSEYIRYGRVSVNGRTHCLKDLFELVAFDEVHQYKGGDTAQGYSMGTLVSTTKNAVLMTGTLTNGRADSLYYLMFRMIPAIRELYTYREHREFARRFGVVETKLRKPTALALSTGRFSGKATWQKSGERIRPGMSPELIRYILERGFFVNLNDLGFQMQPRFDSHQYVQLEDYQQVLYDRFYLDCREAIKNAKKEGVSLAGAYVHRILGYPNAMFRPHILADKEGVVWASAPGIEWGCVHCQKEIGGPEWHCVECHRGQSVDKMKQVCPKGCFEHKGLILLPKEAWLLDRVQANMEDGRKTLVFCRQSDRLDIIDRLMRLVRSKGAAAARLPKGNSRKREGWLLQNSPMLDVLFCNPRSVETGLDLVAFSEAMFYEPEYRVYTCDQAAARIHRLTSPGPVDITWAVYQRTEEAAAVSNIVAGLTIAAMFAGESYALAEYDDGDFIQNMVSRLMDEDLGVIDLDAKFKNFRDRTAMMASLIETQHVQFDIDTVYDLSKDESDEEILPALEAGKELKQLSMF